MEFMLYFIYHSYSMITLLLESVPAFRDTWNEYLGDLARYRMAVEAFDKKDREIWAEVSRYWYGQDGKEENGRIQHHLAVLARPDILQQTFHYTKALISVHPFSNAFDSLIKLITPFMNAPNQKRNLVTSFITTHGALLTQAPVEDFNSRANEYLTTLKIVIREVGIHGHQCVLFMSCNISAIFQYGSKHRVIVTDFTLKSRNPTAENRRAAMKWASGGSCAAIHTTYSDISSQLVLQASSLTFHTLTVILSQVGDSNMSPSVYISMAFVWCLTLNPAAI